MIPVVAMLAIGNARIQRLSNASRVETTMPGLRPIVACSVTLAAVLMGPTTEAVFAAQGQQVGASVSTQPVLPGSSIPAAAQQLFVLANQARALAGVGPLKWDSALAAGALLHCERMVVEGQIAHQYGGEPGLILRAQNAGAHFSLIEENVAVGSYIATIHQGWLDSPGHRANLLSPQVDSVGIAVVSGGGMLYAVADYARAVPVLSREQVEVSVAALIRASGLFIVRDPADARAYCANGSHPSGRSAFLMVWEDPDISALPRDLASRIASGSYRSAVVGACAPQASEPGFTSYRVAVILY
jgi:uncharacterized protein YkwD